MPIYPAILLSPIMRIQSLKHDRYFAILKPSAVAFNSWSLSASLMMEY